MNNLNLNPFTLGADGPRRPTARLSFNKQLTLAFNEAAGNIVVSQVGETFAVQVDPDTGRIALTTGSDRKLKPAYASNWRDIALNAIRGELTGVYGNVKRVYFDIVTYDNAIALVPNGRVVK